MSFLNPLGLLGLLSLPVIIGLHVHSERSRKFSVSSLTLWSFLEVQLRGVKASRIRWSTLLLLDLLVAAFLSLSFAQPQITIPFLSESKTHYLILLDDSTSMLANEIGGSRFAMAQDEIVAILRSLGGQEAATAVTFGGEGEYLGDTREIGKSGLISQITKMSAGSTGTDFSIALSLALAAATNDLNIEVHIFTDGAFEPVPIIDIPYPVFWHLYGASEDNQAVVSIDVEFIGDGSTQVFARIANYDERAVARDVVLYTDGVEAKKLPLTLDAKSTFSHVWKLTGRPETVAVALTGSDDLSQDDEAYLGIAVESIIHVALIADDPNPVDRAVKSLPGVNLDIFSPGKFLPTTSYDLIVYRNTLPDAWPGGTVLVLDPPPDSALLPVDVVQPIVDQPSPQDHLFLESVTYSGVRWGDAWVIDSWEDNFSPIFFAGDLPLLLIGQFGISEVIVLLPRLSDGNFTRHPAFPIMISNIVRYAGAVELPDQMFLGETILLPPKSKIPTISITDPNGSFIVPLLDQTEFGFSQPGYYLFELTDLNGDVRTHTLGVNAGEINESDIRPRDWVASVSGMSESAETSKKQIDLTPWLLGIAIILLILEARRAWR